MTCISTSQLESIGICFKQEPNGSHLILEGSQFWSFFESAFQPCGHRPFLGFKMSSWFEAKCKAKKESWSNGLFYWNVVVSPLSYAFWETAPTLWSYRPRYGYYGRFRCEKWMRLNWLWTNTKPSKPWKRLKLLLKDRWSWMFGASFDIHVWPEFLGQTIWVKLSQ